MDRVAFGKPLAAQGTIQADVAQSRIEIEETRLMVLKAAHMMDLYGNKVSIRIPHTYSPTLPSHIKEWKKQD